MTLNLNNDITVTLTLKGLDFVSDNCVPYGIEINGLKVTGQGWRVMKFFSSFFTGIASDTPFDMNIEIHEPNPNK